jgi:hypothetical protein
VIADTTPRPRLKATFRHAIELETLVLEGVLEGIVSKDIAVVTVLKGRLPKGSCDLPKGS